MHTKMNKGRNVAVTTTLEKGDHQIDFVNYTDERNDAAGAAMLVVCQDTGESSWCNRFQARQLWAGFVADGYSRVA